VGRDGERVVLFARQRAVNMRDFMDDWIERKAVESFNATKRALDKPSRPRRAAARKPSLAAALREAKKAGVPVAAATITGQGVALTFGEATTGTDANPWDEVLKNVAN
jgi:sugar/nucleoside kinase (ribokinase family)